MSSTKLTQKQYQLIVETQGKDIADSMALALGVASSRIGKMQYAPKPVLQAWQLKQISCLASIIILITNYK